MPELSINAELGEVYKYPSVLPISAHQKLSIAQNICVVISEVHRAGYVYGDFNPRNIGLDTNTGLVSFLDTDTYHVTDPSGDKTYRCNVCAPGYAAPELLEKCSDFLLENPSASKNAYAQTPLPTFTQETDNFALAIHIFKLLMNGYTPFGGIIESSSVSQSSPGVGDAAVRRDSYCFKPGYKPQSVAIPDLDAFPNEIADLFTRAFITGKSDPKQRPSTIEWHSALTKYEDTLVTCTYNTLHQYGKDNSACPLCAADERFSAATDGAASHNTIIQTTYKQPPPPVQVTAVSQQTPASSPKPTSTQNPMPQVIAKPTSNGYINIGGKYFSISLTELSLSSTYTNVLQDADFAQLKHMTSLTKLNLTFSRIKDLTPLSSLTHLNELYLSCCGITDLIPLSGLWRLTVLYLDRNQISDLKPLSNLESLIQLNLWSNQISDLRPLSNLRKLTYLDLTSNEISDWSPVSHVPDVVGRRKLPK